MRVRVYVGVVGVRKVFHADFQFDRWWGEGGFGGVGGAEGR